MHTDHEVNKAEQWTISHEADCGHTDTCENITFPLGSVITTVGQWSCGKVMLSVMCVSQSVRSQGGGSPCDLAIVQTCSLWPETWFKHASNGLSCQCSSVMVSSQMIITSKQNTWWWWWWWWWQQQQQQQRTRLRYLFQLNHKWL